jgi:hypothetical protein
MFGGNSFLNQFAKERAKEAEAKINKKAPTPAVTEEQAEGGMNHIISEKPGKKVVAEYFKNRIKELVEKNV